MFRHWFGDEMTLDRATARRVAEAVNRAVHLAAGVSEHLLPYADRVGRLDDEGTGLSGWLRLSRGSPSSRAVAAAPLGALTPGVRVDGRRRRRPRPGLEDDVDAVLMECESGRWVLWGHPLRLTWLDDPDEADRVREAQFE
ncbi:MAG: hypothetical protein M3P95_12960 [Actinomycetota bacterium]|nr:hypothetical protein [Actinomycetota bacterium]